MKLPEFNYAEMEWDNWRAFHRTHKYHTFVQFDTGEFVVCHRRWSPDERKSYDELHIKVVATDDNDCPRLHVPGSIMPTSNPIPKSHLNYKGQQVLLLDLDHKRAVSVDRYLTKDNAPLVPVRFTDRSHNVVAWYAGPDAVPVATPIVRYYPQPLTFNERTHIKELENAAKVWLQMQADPDALMRQHYKVAAPPVIYFIDTLFGALTTEQRTAIATKGFDMIVKEGHPWLTFNGEE